MQRSRYLLGNGRTMGRSGSCFLENTLEEIRESLGRLGKKTIAFFVQGCDCLLTEMEEI